MPVFIHVKKYPGSAGAKLATGVVEVGARWYLEGKSSQWSSGMVWNEWVIICIWIMRLGGGIWGRCLLIFRSVAEAMNELDTVLLRRNERMEQQH